MATAAQLERLADVIPAAQTSARQFGIPASVTLAQWILESSWGTSKLASGCRNYFGVKAAGNPARGAYMEFPTTEYEGGHRVLTTALFAAYVSDAQAFAAHARLIAQSPRYARAMAVAGAPERFALALQQCGYSTNPHYATDLVELIHLYDLTDHDVPPAPPATAVRAA